MKKNVCYGIIIEDTFSIYSMQLSQVPKHSIMNIQKQIVCIMIALGTIVALWILEYILTAKSLDRKTEYMILLFSVFFSKGVKCGLCKGSIIAMKTIILRRKQ